MILTLPPRDLWWAARVARAAARRAPDLAELLAPLADAVPRREDYIALAAVLLPHVASAVDRRDADSSFLLPVGRGWWLAYVVGADGAPSDRDLPGILRENNWHKPVEFPDMWDGVMLAWYRDPDGDLYLLVGKPGREPFAVEVKGEQGQQVVDTWLAAVNAGLGLRSDRLLLVREAWQDLVESSRAQEE